MIMTIDELSGYLKVSKETLYKMVQKKEIPASKIGNQWRFQKTRIDSWFDDLCNETTSENQNEIDTMEDDNGICETGI